MTLSQGPGPACDRADRGGPCGRHLVGQRLGAAHGRRAGGKEFGGEKSAGGGYRPPACDRLAAGHPRAVLCAGRVPQDSQVGSGNGTPTRGGCIINVISDYQHHPPLLTVNSSS